MSTANEQLVRRWFHEVWNLRSEATVHELLTPESVAHGESGHVAGAEPFLEAFYRPFLAAFPDLQIVVEDTITQGDQVAVRWAATGTHRSAWLSIPATHKKISFRGITWVRVRDGKLAEGWDCWSITGLIQALQGTPPPSVTVF